MADRAGAGVCGFVEPTGDMRYQLVLGIKNNEKLTVHAARSRLLAKIASIR